MATEQDTIMQAIAQAVVEAVRVVVQTMALVRTEGNEGMQNVVHKIGGHIMQ